MNLSAVDLEKIRNAADIVQLLSSRVNLVKSGAAWCGDCPFCNGTGQSFRVQVARQVWHCFKCGAGGDVFKFFMDVDKVDFCTAVQNVATRLGFVLSVSNDTMLLLECPGPTRANKPDKRRRGVCRSRT
jgi:DNA primase